MGNSCSKSESSYSRPSYKQNNHCKQNGQPELYNSRPVNLHPHGINTQHSSNQTYLHSNNQSSQRPKTETSHHVYQPNTLPQLSSYTNHSGLAQAQQQKYSQPQSTASVKRINTWESNSQTYPPPKNFYPHSRELANASLPVSHRLPIHISVPPLYQEGIKTAPFQRGTGYTEQSPAPRVPKEGHRSGKIDISTRKDVSYAAYGYDNGVEDGRVSPIRTDEQLRAGESATDWRATTYMDETMRNRIAYL